MVVGGWGDQNSSTDRWINDTGPGQFNKLVSIAVWSFFKVGHCHLEIVDRPFVLFSLKTVLYSLLRSAGRHWDGKNDRINKDDILYGVLWPNIPYY